ncbi:MAG: ATP-binding protein [Spirochaetaceae bacterium]|jgi:hypothetical protein|nr:ATP-binding protein [Spirochaetaceae bacterium]
MRWLLPVGIQDFVKIREDSFLYIDKTAKISELLSDGGGCFFLSRPRRFGKSLLCSTLAALFEGRQELFSGLAIEKTDWEWKKHPVIRIDLNAGNYKAGLPILVSMLSNMLSNTALDYGLNIRGQYPAEQLLNIIKDLHALFHERVVVIIDEYDKPLLETLEDASLNSDIRNELKAFYGVLKSCDAYLRFVFVTGVSKFAHVSVFSDLNQLVDLSLNPIYADICGITQQELETNFAPEIDAVLHETGVSRRWYLDELRRFYNGYRFSEKALTVYNPFGLLNHFYNHGKFFEYWYETGSPAFLITLIENQNINILNLNRMRVRLDDFRKYDIQNMRAEPVLYQTGYLTIADYDSDMEEFILDWPNEEVRGAFARSLLDHYLRPSAESAQELHTELPRALYYGKIDTAKTYIQAMMATIPYDIIKDTECYFQTVIHLIFTMLGFKCRSEVRIAAGRIDTLVETKNYVYCFEFKLHGSAEEALAQIDTKDYLLPWKGSGKTLVKVGVSFDSQKRNISDWKSVRSE